MWYIIEFISICQLRPVNKSLHPARERGYRIYMQMVKYGVGVGICKNNLGAEASIIVLSYQVIPWITRVVIRFHRERLIGVDEAE